MSLTSESTPVLQPAVIKIALINKAFMGPPKINILIDKDRLLGILHETMQFWIPEGRAWCFLRKDTARDATISTTTHSPFPLPALR
jgi:hypothetical protein